MRRKVTYTCSWMMLVAVATLMNCAFACAAQTSDHDTSSYFFPKKKVKKSFLSFTLPPIHAGVISTTRFTPPKTDDKLLSNVEVYPNPITDQLNLKLNVSRSSNVTIRIVDVLGNDIMTLFSQRVESGELSRSYPLSNKLNKGFYFVKIIAGTESVIKRISIL
jgi:hypothetical protein